jgi:D-Tyr-tRNAtyr deacylase
VSSASRWSRSSSRPCGGWARRSGTGVFGAEMQVSLVNDGPVTLILDSDL